MHLFDTNRFTLTSHSLLVLDLRLSVLIALSVYFFLIIPTSKVNKTGNPFQGGYLNFCFSQCLFRLHQGVLAPKIAKSHIPERVVMGRR